MKMIIVILVFGLSAHREYGMNRTSVLLQQLFSPDFVVSSPKNLPKFDALAR
jgi:hypothetical protein